MLHITITNKDTGETLHDLDTNCIIGAINNPEEGCSTRVCLIHRCGIATPINVTCNLLDYIDGHTDDEDLDAIFALAKALYSQRKEKEA